MTEEEKNKLIQITLFKALRQDLDYNPIRKNLHYMGIFRRTLVINSLPIIPQGGPVTEVLIPTLKQLRPGWAVVEQPDANVIEQKISYCKRCNIQNEYMNFNPDWTCLSCRS